MFKVPLRQDQIIWMFRGVLMINLVAISWLAMTGSQVAIAEMASDKTNHLFAFFVLAYCLDMSFPRQRFLSRKTPLLLAYGILIELLQGQLDFRSASGLDVLADSAGFMLYWVLRGWFRRLFLPRAYNQSNNTVRSTEGRAGG